MVCSLCITAYICCLVYTICIDLTCLPGRKICLMPCFFPVLLYFLPLEASRKNIYKSFKIMYCIVYQPKIVPKNGNEKYIYLLCHSAQKKHNPFFNFLTRKRKLSFSSVAWRSTIWSLAFRVNMHSNYLEPQALQFSVLKNSFVNK